MFVRRCRNAHLLKYVVTTVYLRNAHHWLSEGVSSRDNQRWPDCYPLTCRWERHQQLRIFIGENRRMLCAAAAAPKSVVVVLRFRRFCGFPTAPVSVPDVLYLLVRRERRVDELSGAWRAPIGRSATDAAAAAAATIETIDGSSDNARRATIFTGISTIRGCSRLCSASHRWKPIYSSLMH